MTKGYYFIGICGQVMSGLALQLAREGHRVSGVAINAYPPASTDLIEAGIEFYTTYDKSHLKHQDMVVLANDIPADNIELLEAKRLHLEIKSFPQLVEELTARKKRIVVSGTHGKTTTTTLIAWLLDQAGYNPDYLIGMKGANLGRSVKLSDSQVVIIEGDEYSSSQIDRRSKFMFYHPDILILTSLEWDHPDLFPTFDHVIKAFDELVDSMPSDKIIIACADDPYLPQLLSGKPHRIIWYGQTGESDWKINSQKYHPQTTFTLQSIHQHVDIKSPLAGQHNTLNVSAAYIVCNLLGISDSSFSKGLQTFAGADRRFVITGQVNHITIIDDYAHHPSEIKATISGAKQRFVQQWRHGSMWACYQPHTYSRVKALLQDYASAFSSADHILLLPIEAAREESISADISSSDIARQIISPADIHVVEDVDQALDRLAEQLQPGDVLLSMSVANSHQLPQRLTNLLEQKWSKELS